MKPIMIVVVVVILACAGSAAWAEPIHEAASSGNLAKVQELLAKNVKLIDAKDTQNFPGQTPLHVAARLGHKEVVELLISKGAKVDAADDDGWQPLHLAAYGGFIKSVTLLLDKGAKIDAECVSGTALHIAAGAGHEEVCQYLLSKNASLSKKIGEQKWTPLHSAAYMGQAEMVKFLIDKGADFAETDAQGKTPRDLAVDQGHNEVAYFLEAKARDSSAGQ